MKEEHAAGDTPADLLIIGGGINGAGIARDAAGRGLTVVLCDQDDLASGTSSASTKLIHGGLRYLEQYDFRLVRESLRERETLLAIAPHIVRPLTFILPHEPHLRPAWLIRLGLLLYDHLGGRSSLPRSRSVDLDGVLGAPLRPDLRRGFSYGDGWVEDSRLVVLTALDAAEHGATILTRTRCIAARRDGTLWEATIRNRRDGSERVLRARALVNAAGPWVGTVARDVLGRRTPAPVRLVKGSHIVVPRLYRGDHAYILQNRDRRIVFTIPFEADYTLIGTTDIPVDGDPGAAAIDAEEIAYLCDLLARYFRDPPVPRDVVWSYAGVRALYDDHAATAAANTREYVLELDDEGGAPLLSVIGGKLTTHRNLAEYALKKLRRHFPAMAGSWTAKAPLPGGDLGGLTLDAFIAAQQARHPGLPPALLTRYARAYGSRLARIVGGATTPEDLGARLGDDVFEAELRYLVGTEWAMTPEDVLYRRSKLALHVAAETRSAIDRWFTTLR